MTEQQKPGPVDDPRIYFAAERTLLAWVRTGLAMMGFGFVVARFGLFLRELAAARDLAHLPPAQPQHTGLSLYFGTALVVLGVVVTLLSAAAYWKTIARLDRGERLEFRKLSLAVISALVLAALGAGMALYLAFGV
jgi:putative membrane protein